MPYEKYFIMGYFVLATLAGFALMGIDKRRAVKRAWRIPERVLIGTAFLGGGLGAFLGMYVFRHKTSRTKFLVLLPVAAVLSVFLAYRLGM
ncbi:uncharacterized membrane protein YsdA (DUF1294 family) [Anaerotaenia torta]|uniref:DUF1294 domain-containing protein n=1 Tax=Anaerotaenia torta TaxID=433293 RepID=UPI003D1C3056